MMKSVFRTALIISLFTLLAPATSLAALTLSTTAPDVPVYSGPGERFRVLAVLPLNTEIKAANEIVSSEAGRFYRVLVKLGEKQRAIGFIPANGPIKVGGEDEDEDDLSKYGAVALISKAAQVTFSTFRDQQSLWTVGYMHYLSPGFYTKGFFGQWITPVANGSVLGGEIGNDSLLVGSVSGFVTYGLGIFSPGANNTIFSGSSKLNVFMNATLGIRYNIEGFASIAIAGAQAAMYNQNNSLISTGLQVSLEVGL